MKHCFVAAAVCSLWAVLLPALLLRGAAPPSPVSAAIEPSAPPAPAQTLRADAGLTVTLLTGGRVRTLTLEEYLPGVVAGEMPAAFSIDALRAQAAAARTYALYKKHAPTPAHPEAEVCDDPACCQVWLDENALRARWEGEYERYAERIRAAVEDTDGVILTSEGAPILACFHASSPGMTESSAALWGTALPYLVSVESPETDADVPNFVTAVEVSADELRCIVQELAPRADFSGDPGTWVGEMVTDASGRVAAMRLGGAAVLGTALREAFSLRSTAFTLAWTGEAFRFTVTGSGHGAGMSQYGAEVMAKNGSTWQEILLHYYTGAALSRIG